MDIVGRLIATLCGRAGVLTADGFAAPLRAGATVRVPTGSFAQAGAAVATHATSAAKSTGASRRDTAEGNVPPFKRWISHRRLAHRRNVGPFPAACGPLPINT